MVAGERQVDRSRAVKNQYPKKETVMTTPKTNDHAGAPHRPVSRRMFLQGMAAPVGALVLGRLWWRSRHDARRSGSLARPRQPQRALRRRARLLARRSNTGPGSRAAKKQSSCGISRIRTSMSTSPARPLAPSTTTKSRPPSRLGTGGPDVAQVEFQLLTSLVVGGAILPITQDVAGDKDKFVDWTWQQVSLGGDVYAIPQDIGPMGMYYRKDLFDQYGIAVPTTWDEIQRRRRSCRRLTPLNTSRISRPRSRASSRASPGRMGPSGSAPAATPGR